MIPTTLASAPPRCFTEYGRLEHVLLCPPTYFQIRDVINQTQRHFVDDINLEKADTQHRHFMECLQREGVEVELLPAEKRFPEQVFTRDIGFTLGSHLFVARMDENVRKGEETLLQKWLTNRGIPHSPIPIGSIEGGDVLVDDDIIWIGDSGRTSRTAIEYLRITLPHFRVISLSFPEKYLHLDCVFNILSHREALVYPPAFPDSDLRRLSSRYHLIEVEAEEQFTLGTNILSIGNRTVISQPINPRVNRKLRQRGFRVLEVELSEIIKSGGAFRCCSLPLRRT
ncbi:dimethylarginine dimethylaminohydrolase family protein [Desmospora profundinema]|uniref:N-dimethylarginine dimethylaminohydrolase n=1 Tax=Desmospora profundinema TaxID=1571184 RepID=A0ABU1ISH8_9BACL|nr:dimethylarginine dimethylaminohydrolase family protein [Desmospora profundinema]MDR6227403.1 N-dimethylarginine dimethylaminohydrolase [Desmospora profundinema]